NNLTDTDAFIIFCFVDLFDSLFCERGFISPWYKVCLSVRYSYVIFKILCLGGFFLSPQA
ncbi:hypothetical protein ACTMPD_23080, partial [Salmonella enterica subsp. enterica serovar Rochdale]|uniref:hypothetical protein n=1 Tax=Salmonella enterica TaxID=28901 RepID=UPI003F888FBD